LDPDFRKLWEREGLVGGGGGGERAALFEGGSVWRSIRTILNSEKKSTTAKKSSSPVRGALQNTARTRSIGRLNHRGGRSPALKGEKGNDFSLQPDGMVEKKKRGQLRWPGMIRGKDDGQRGPGGLLVKKKADGGGGEGVLGIRRREI